MEFLNLKGGCIDSSESAHVKMPHCWKSHATAHWFFILQEEFRRLYTQLELLKQRNMKIGNRHLQHKLSAMTEAAQKDDSPDESTPTTPNMNGKRVVINLDDFKESTTL